MKKDNKNKRILFIIIAIIIIILLLLGLKSCSSNDSNSRKDNTANTLESNKKPTNTNKKEEPSKTDDKKSEESKEEPKKEEVAKPTENKPTSNNEAKPSTSKPNTKPSVKPQSNTPSHTHNWVAQYKTIHHDAQGHHEKVCVKEAWDEKVEKYDQVAHDICNGCGLDLTANNIRPRDHMKESVNCGGHHTEWVDVVTYETVHHDAIYENKWVVDKEAYDEKVLDGYKCSSCGAKK